MSFQLNLVTITPNYSLTSCIFHFLFDQPDACGTVGMAGAVPSHFRVSLSIQSTPARVTGLQLETQNGRDGMRWISGQLHCQRPTLRHDW
ncbi:hypothetical protein L0128_11665, partial [candidate division KSB1 bacterium]|nr:hypothetical protein [candidate division KSB1 bacterium]